MTYFVSSLFEYTLALINLKYVYIHFEYDMVYKLTMFGEILSFSLGVTWSRDQVSPRGIKSTLVSKNQRIYRPVIITCIFLGNNAAKIYDQRGIKKEKTDKEKFKNAVAAVSGGKTLKGTSKQYGVLFFRIILTIEREFNIILLKII